MGDWKILRLSEGSRIGLSGLKLNPFACSPGWAGRPSEKVKVYCEVVKTGN